MRRWTLRILICLILGFLTTAIVASGFERWAGPTVSAVSFEYAAPEGGGPWEWHVFRHDVTGATLIRLRRFRGRFNGDTKIPEWARPHNDASSPGWDGVRSFDIIAFGWPLRCTRVLQKEQTMAVVQPGLIINTLFYGVIWFGIFLGFGSARRVIRKKRGRCPKCNYDLRGEFDAGCPECGWGRT